MYLMNIDLQCPVIFSHALCHLSRVQDLLSTCHLLVNLSFSQVYSSYCGKEIGRNDPSCHQYILMLQLEDSTISRNHPAYGRLLRDVTPFAVLSVVHQICSNELIFVLIIILKYFSTGFVFTITSWREADGDPLFGQNDNISLI